jgi:8-amino-7-oxononanoate synthase
LTEIFEKRLENKLKQLYTDNLFRKPLALNHDFLNLATNDYFLLRHNKEVLTVANEIAQKYGTGSGASPLLSGYLPCHQMLINKLLSWKHKKFGMLYNSGYMANQALVKNLPGKNDLVLVDTFIHHSIAQALNRGIAKFKRYNHLDLGHLEELLSKNINIYDTVFIITESIFSMDGDYPDLKKLVKLKRKYPFVLILDEAHGTGVMGVSGAGLAEETGTTNEVDIIIGTFGKSLAGMGAYVLTNVLSIIQYLTNKSGEYIYSTFLSPYQTGVALATIDILRSSDAKRKSLKLLSFWLRSILAEYINVQTNYNTPIIPIIMGDNTSTLELQSLLLKKGIIVGAIRPPTVPNGSSRIRLSLNSELSKEQLEPLILTIKECSKK